MVSGEPRMTVQVTKSSQELWQPREPHGPAGPQLSWRCCQEGNIEVEICRTRRNLTSGEGGGSCQRGQCARMPCDSRAQSHPPVGRGQPSHQLAFLLEPTHLGDNVHEGTWLYPLHHVTLWSIILYRFCREEPKNNTQCHHLPSPPYLPHPPPRYLSEAGFHISPSSDSFIFIFLNEFLNIVR